MLIARQIVVIIVSLINVGLFSDPDFAPETDAQATLDLPSILKKTAEYCRKLESVTLDYICREEIYEIIDPLLDVLKPFEMSQDWTRFAPGAGQPSSLRMSYLYDYQYIREDRKIHERRTLLQENGIKKNEPNATLQTSSFIFGNALLTPVGLFAQRFQLLYDYSITGQDKINRKPVLIVEIRPKPDAIEAPCAYGKAWIDPITADVLKIEWRDKKVKNWEIFERRGRHFLRTPRLTMQSEFIDERNGIRFPSKLYIEEAYIDSRERVFIRTKTNVVYNDFNFFTVEWDVR
jgi:hypothetical protein